MNHLRHLPIDDTTQSIKKRGAQNNQELTHFARRHRQVNTKLSHNGIIQQENPVFPPFHYYK